MSGKWQKMDEKQKSRGKKQDDCFEDKPNAAIGIFLQVLFTQKHLIYLCICRVFSTTFRIFTTV